MLSRLLRREWILNRRLMLINFGFFAAFEIYAAHSMDGAREWLVVACIYTSFLATVLFVREDKFRATAWTCSLPVTRREVVRARFVLAWLMVLSSLALAAALAALLPAGRVPVGEIFDPASLLIGGAVVTFVLALMLPFTIRFGLAGIMIFLVGAQVLGIVGLTLARVFGGDGGGGRGPIKAAFSNMSDGLVALRDVMSPGPFALLVVVCLIVANWAGYRLAVLLFHQRDL